MSYIAITKDYLKIASINEDGTVIKEITDPAPYIYAAIGEKKRASLSIITVMHDTNTPIGTEIYLDAALFMDSSSHPTGIPARGWSFIIGSSTTTGVEYDMTFYGFSAYNEKTALNMRATVEFLEMTASGLDYELNYLISLEFFMTYDVMGYLSNIAFSNRNRLLLSRYDDTITNPVGTLARSNSVYGSTTKNMGLYIFQKSPIYEEGSFENQTNYKACWYEKGIANGATPDFNNGVWGFQGETSMVLFSPSPLSTYENTIVTHWVNYNATLADHACAWLICTDGDNPGFEFPDNYQYSFGEIIDVPGAGTVIHNAIMGVAHKPYADGALTGVDFTIDHTKLNFASKYRIVVIWYDTTNSLITSYISDELTADYIPQFTGDEFNIMGSFTCYGNTTLGNYREGVLPGERIKNSIHIDYSFDRLKDFIATRLGLTITNDIRQLMKSITVEIIEETTVGGVNIIQVLQRDKLSRNGPYSPTVTYSSTDSTNLYMGKFGLTLNSVINWANGVRIDYDFRVRFENWITNLETYHNGVLQALPTSNQNWSNRDLYLRWKIELEYSGFNPVFTDNIWMYQKMDVAEWDSSTRDVMDAKWDDGTTDTPKYVCIGDAICGLFKLSKAAAMKFFAFFMPPVYNVTTEQEKETYVGAALMPQLQSASLLNVDTDIDGTNWSEACPDTSLLTAGNTYKLVGVAKDEKVLVAGGFTVGIVDHGGGVTFDLTITSSAPTLINGYLYYRGALPVPVTQLGYAYLAKTATFVIHGSAAAKYIIHQFAAKNENYITAYNAEIDIRITGGVFVIHSITPF
jgi:hypothetical protein